MTKSLSYAVLGVLLAGVAGLVVFDLISPKPPKPLTSGEKARADRAAVDRSYNTPKAKEAYKSFIDKWKDNPDKKVQDEVGAARIRLAYTTAKSKDWPEARREFKEAALQYKGTGTMSADFGGIKDQALYQAAVTLNAEGKKAEYRAALVDFIKTQPMSPLVNACYKRLVAVDGKATAGDDALLQSALTKQEKEVRFETSVCGPKCIVKLLEILGKAGSDKAASDYKQVAKLCGTTDHGTTLDGLRKGLRSFGLSYYGFQVSRQDLPRVATPSILYLNEHYYVIAKVAGQVLTAYDPMKEKQQQLDFSKVPDDKFQPIFLLPASPETQG
jgi:hypothetical protein